MSFNSFKNMIIYESEKIYNIYDLYMNSKIESSIAACVFSEDQREILLIKRRDVPVWVLPGGGIEVEETPQEAALREIKEETGFTIKIKRKIGEYTPINRLTRFTHLFEGSITAGTATIGEETADIKFFNLNSLPPLPPPYLDWITDSLIRSPHMFKKKLDQITYKRLFYFLATHPILVMRFLLSRIGLRINS
jgi:8-oxo-dGTP diphosphatase